MEINYENTANSECDIEDGIKSPLDELPFSTEEILAGIDYRLVTHVHPDHFTEDYLPKSIMILVQNDADCEKVKALGFENVVSIEDGNTKIGNVTIMKTPAVHGDNEMIAAILGETSGYLLTGEKKRYISPEIQCLTAEFQRF